MKKFILLVCALGMLCACNEHNKQNEQHAVSTTAADSTVTFGYLPTAVHNQSYQRGLTVALDEANSKNLKLDGQSVHFAWQAASASQIKSLARTVTANKWQAVLGQINPQTTAVVEKIALPAMSLAIDDNATADKTNATVFRVWPTVSQQGKLIALYLYQQNVHHIAIVNHGQPSALSTTLQTQLQANGQSADSYRIDHFSQTELNQLVAQLTANKPDLLFYIGDGASAAQLVQRLQQNQLLIPLMMTGSVCESSFIRQAGQFAPGSMAIMAGLALPEMKSASHFVAAYQQKYHQQPNAAAAYAYDAAWAVITAMKLANSAQPKAYLPKLRSLNISNGLLSGALTFDNHGVRNEMAMTVYQVEEDKWIVGDTIHFNVNVNLNQTEASAH